MSQTWEVSNLGGLKQLWLILKDTLINLQYEQQYCCVQMLVDAERENMTLPCEVQ